MSILSNGNRTSASAAIPAVQDVVPPDRGSATKRFSRAADAYDGLATVQKTMGEQLRLWLGEALPQTTPNNGKLLDLGCGTGLNLRELQDNFDFADLVGVDLAPGMVQAAQQKTPEATIQCADIESLPFPDRTFDVIFSNAALQWCNLEIAACEIQRVMKPEGLLLCTTFGPNTLRELRSALEVVQDGPISLHSHPDFACVAERLESAGLEIERGATRELTTYFDSPKSLLKSVRGLGAAFAPADEKHRYFGRQRYRDLLEELESCRCDRGYTLSYEAFFFQCTSR